MKYDDDWWKEPFFMSSRETAFCMNLLHCLDKEILIGQISYKQQAELYNDIHDYLEEKQNRRYTFYPNLYFLNFLVS